MITRNNKNITSTIFRKQTNNGECLNYNGICPDAYKTSVIKNFIHRAMTICSNWVELNSELERIKQILINNNFPNALVDKTIKKYLDKEFNINNNTTNNENTHNQQQPTIEEDRSTVEHIIQTEQENTTDQTAPSEAVTTTERTTNPEQTSTIEQTTNSDQIATNEETRTTEQATILEPNNSIEQATVENSMT